MTTDMPSSSELSVEQQQRLSELLDEYFVALEAGRPLDRQALFEAHPDLAGPLSEYLDSLDFLQDAAAGFRAQPETLADTPADGEARKEIGDFEIGREVGRGGMGIVYEARQLSLNRRVALKVLPFAALLDSTQIARFRNEAQAAAQLHHPHIVPVYSVGVDRGVHFYAMQLIDGQPLDQAIEELRQKKARPRDPRIDETAEWGQTTQQHPRDAHDWPPPGTEHEGELGEDDRADGESLSSQYSHSVGSYCRTIAGLAMQAAEALHCAHEYGIVHRDVKPSNLLLDTDGKLWITDFGLARFRTDTQLTRSGDFVGTLRYMSPEQARGESHLVDHRTDIYSLGVTLYELLALKHPVRAQQPAAILLKLESETPYHLRLWNAKIPVDLANIVQKAMAKPRDERYATAQEFADDLRRFLDGKPTIARRPSPVDRAGKWIRRHRVVASFVAALLAAVVGLLACTGLLLQQQRVTHGALATAKRNHDRYRTQLAVSKNTLALIHDQQGEHEQARSAFERAVELQREIVRETPSAEEPLRNLAATLTNLSFFYARHEPARATAGYRETLDIQRRLVDCQPGDAQYLQDLALTHSNFGSFQARQGNAREAVKAYRRAIEILDQPAMFANQDAARDRAVAYNNLGMTQDALGMLAESKSSFRMALQLLQASFQGQQPTPIDASRLGGIHNNLGMVLERQGKWEAARRSYANAIECQSLAAGSSPQVARFRDLIAQHRENHSRVVRKIGQPNDT